MPFTPDGRFVEEDVSVSGRVAGLLNSSNPFITQARTGAKQAANQRGLLNSSLAVQAGEQAALSAALPIASQESAQANQRNIAERNIQANDREKASAALVAFNNAYTEGFRSIQNNTNIPADARARSLEHLSALQDSNFRLVEQIYGIDLEWASPSAISATPPPAAPRAPQPNLPAGRIDLIDEAP